MAEWSLAVLSALTFSVSIEYFSGLRSRRQGSSCVDRHSPEQGTARKHL